jgi:3-hydroxyacyl-CoA dehydrogenase
MLNKRIRKVAVLGSGLMGTGIAAHLAGCGLEVLLLDILPFDLKEEEAKKPAARNRMAATSLANALKAKPAPFYDNKFASRITGRQLRRRFSENQRLRLDHRGRGGAFGHQKADL